jgi:hypothetical protein
VFVTLAFNSRQQIQRFQRSVSFLPCGELAPARRSGKWGFVDSNTLGNSSSPHCFYLLLLFKETFRECQFESKKTTAGMKKMFWSIAREKFEFGQPTLFKAHTKRRFSL